MCGLSHSSEPLWETLRVGENSNQQPKIFSFLAAEKSPLIESHLLLSKVSFIPYQHPYHSFLIIQQNGKVHIFGLAGTPPTQFSPLVAHPDLSIRNIDEGAWSAYCNDFKKSE